MSPIPPRNAAEGGRLRILFVAQAVSIHTARWLGQIQDQGWDLHLFDMLGGLPHAELGGVTEYSLILPRRIRVKGSNPSYGHPFFLQRGLDPFPLSIAGYFLRRLFRDRLHGLVSLIRRIQPDIIHSFELQTESYHLLPAIQRLGGRLGAPWVVTTWGSDIYYFQRFPQHLERIKQVLSRCDYLIPDCRRDEALARSYGFRGQVPFILPGSGGYPVEAMRARIRPGAASTRRLIMVKGYEGWAGQAMHALKALELTADLVRDFEIILYAASPVVAARAMELADQYRLNIRVAPRSPHHEILELFGSARLAVGVNSTDGVPNAMLEAMTMGALPIQSDTESTGEWITHGENGLLVDAGDPGSIAEAIRRGVREDRLVDEAAERNARLVFERLDTSIIKPRVVEMYRQVARTPGPGRK